MYRLIGVGIGVGVAVILAVGCGGGGNDQATAQISEAQYMKQAKAICAKTHKELGAVFLGQGGTESGNPLDEMASLLRQEAEGLDALAGPEEVEARVDPLIANVSQASEILAQEGKNGLKDQRLATYKHEAKELHLPNC